MSTSQHRKANALVTNA